MKSRYSMENAGADSNMATRPDNRESYFFTELDLTGSGLPAIVQRVLQNPTGMHRHHDFVELALIVEGSCIHEISTGERYRLGSHDFFIIPDGTRHSYSGNEALKLINLLVKRQFMASLLEELSKVEGFGKVVAPPGSFLRIPPLSKPLFESFLDTASRLEAESWERGAGRDQMVKALLTALFIKLFRFVSTGGSAKTQPDFGRLASYLEEHIRRPAKVEEMAKAGGVSARTLLRRFKAQTGLSPMEYLNNLRLAKACRLLRETSMDIKGVAFECGFQDSNYFSRQCRRTLGRSPRELRRAHVMALEKNPFANPQ